jgi:hypothetical protein
MSKATTLTAVLTGALLVLGGACSKKKDDHAPTKPSSEVTPPAPVPPPPPPAPGPGPAAGPAVAETRDVGLATPESVLPLADQDLYLVSNINGAPTATDDNGFISKLDPDGKVVELKWIDGAKADVKLDAPKGMAVLNGTLYVADITTVRMFDLATGAPKGSVEVKGSTFLNDVAAAGDKVYVTDSGLTPDFKSSGTEAVYAIDGAGTATKLAGGTDLKGPNGITVVDGSVWVVPFGGAELYKVADGKKAEVYALPGGGLDGLDVLGDGRVIVSSWEAKAVFIGKPGGVFTMMIESVESPADIGVDRKRNRVAVPLFNGNAVRFFTIPPG